MSNANIAKFFMLGTLFIWGAFDVFLYIKYGNAATESATTWREGYLFAGLTVCIGMLMGHFFGQYRAPSAQSVTPPKWRYYGKWAMTVGMIPWLFLDAYGIVANRAPSVVDTFVWRITGHQVWLVFLIGFVLGGLFEPMNEPTEF